MIGEAVKLEPLVILVNILVDIIGRKLRIVCSTPLNVVSNF